MINLLPLLGLATLGSLAGLLGGVLLISQHQLRKTISLHAIPFAAGVMLAVSLLDILPEAIEHGEVEGVLKIVLVVFIVAFFLEQFFLHLHHHEEHERTIRSSIPLIIFGDTVHNFIDGLAIAAAYLVEPSLGVLVALATFAHEIPHEMGDFGLMLKAGFSKTKVILVNLVSAAATYFGVATVLVLQTTFEDKLSVLLAVAGGLFLYIASSDLLPEVQEEHKDSPWHQAGLFLAGVLVMWALIQVFPHAE